MKNSKSITTNCWQPITTAPRDEDVQILAITSTGQYLIGHMFKYPNPEVDWQFTAHAIIFNATHWMNLPKPPFKTNKKGDARRHRP